MLPPVVDDQLFPGRVISGRFRLERQLGHGGMGTVWEARHLSLETQIAIKFLNADLSRRQDVLARFAREATSAARIRSPHVVSILDSGFTEDGRGFIAMELLRGEDLSRRLARFGKLTVNETCLLVTQVARGLAKAHSVGVVHRDLKPENIFVLDEDDAFTVKILDFGIAKSVGSEAATHKTDTGQLLGTPLYMSPEQAVGHPLDSRSDLYSLAVVAYRCLAGRPPFVAPAVGALIVAVSTQPAPPPSEFNPDLPASLDEWFAGALAKEPKARICQTATELAASFKLACAAALEQRPTSSTRIPVATAPQSLPSVPRTDTEELPTPSAEEVATTISAPPLAMAGSTAPVYSPKRRQRWPARVLLAAVALCALVLAFRPRHPRSALPQSASESGAEEAAKKEAALRSTAATLHGAEAPTPASEARTKAPDPVATAAADAERAGKGGATASLASFVQVAATHNKRKTSTESEANIGRKPNAEGTPTGGAGASPPDPASASSASHAPRAADSGADVSKPNPALPPIDREDPWLPSK